MLKPQIAIIDFGSQYTHLITRRIRQLGVLAEIFPTDTSVEKLKGVKGIILSGGPKSVHNSTAILYDKRVLDCGVPILGLCYGHQLIAQHFGGVVKPGQTREYGFAQMKLTKPSSLFSGISIKSQIWMSHGDSVQAIPQGFTAIAKTDDCPVTAMCNEQQQIYGLQFHPEVTHSVEGLSILKNFLFDICHCEKNWSLEKYWKEIVATVKQQVGKRNVFLLVSGGVDSTVCFAVLEKILGKKRVFGLHIDNGFMREGESAWVAQALSKAGFDNLHVYNAQEEFLKATKGIIDPEAKRKAIGKTFLEIKDKVMKKQKMNKKNWILGQGTIYPDTIETGGTKHADTIKTHHNRVQEILDLMKLGDLVEPLVELYKDEVREVGKKLGLPKSLLERHPFPGPGLAIRALCSNGKEKIENKIQINRALKKHTGPNFNISVLPVRSVGVQGDNRTYQHPAAISGIASWKKLHELSVKITNQVSQVNRVVYVVEPKQPNLSQIKTKKVTLTKQRLDLLREVDTVVTNEIKKEGLYNKIWQFPVVLAPLSLSGGETVILRPVESKEAMTVNFFHLPRLTLNRIARHIMKIPGIDMVCFDVTNKPPGTIEWE